MFSKNGRSNALLLPVVSGITVGITADVDEVIFLHEYGDHDKFAHYAEKNAITRAFVTGKPIIAMCGKVWIPTRAPDGFPTCSKCKEMYDQLLWFGRGLIE